MTDGVGLRSYLATMVSVQGSPGGGEGGSLGDKTQSAAATDSWCVLGTGPRGWVRAQTPRVAWTWAEAWTAVTLVVWER